MEEITIGIILAIVVQFATSLILRKSDKKIKHKDQINLLTSELGDLLRHCSSNLKVLEAINLNEGVPSKMHFEKLKIMETSILFSQDAYLYINSKYTSNIHRIRLEVRNMNIEIENILSLSKEDASNKELLSRYIDYLIFKTEIMVDKIPERLNNLRKTNSRMTSRPSGISHQDETPVRIVYK